MKTMTEFKARMTPGTRVSVVHHRASMTRRDRFGNPVWKASQPQLRRVLSSNLDLVRFEREDGAYLGLGLILTYPRRREVEFKGNSMTVYAETRWNGPKGQSVIRLPLVTYRFV